MVVIGVRQKPPILVACALSISDNNKNNRLELMEYVLTRDNDRRVAGNKVTGQFSLKRILKTYFNDRGLNKEPLGYHEFPMRRLIPTAIMLENANYNIMNDSRYDKLFKGTYVIGNYTFPHSYGTAFGDNGVIRQQPNLLEIAYRFAKRYNHPDKDIIAYELHKLINDGIYVRGILLDPGSLYEVIDLSLLTYEGSIEKPHNKVIKKRSDEVDFANHYLQRNGDNQIEGLMYTVNAGGDYIHSGPNGLTIELYAKGFILGHDSGAENYQTRIYREYQKNTGSHNTVVVGNSGVSRLVPAYLLSIDPPLGATVGVSDNHSFSLTKYRYNSSAQRRNIVMNRTSKNSGYYLDVFWSEGNRTDYIYHNQTAGIHNVTVKQDGVIKTENNGSISGPGYHYFFDKKTYHMNGNNSTAEFKIDLNNFNKNVYMKAWIMGENNRNYYSARTPYTVSVRHEFNRLSNSVIVIRDTSPNYNTKPYIVLYEPYRGDGRGVIDHVRRMNGTKGQSHYVGIAVSNSDRNGQDRPDLQYLISSKDNNTAFDHEGVQFKGYSATISHNNGELSSLYLGKGSYVANYGYRLEKITSEDISAYLKVEGQKMTLTSQNDTQVTLSYRNNIERSYTNLGLYYKVKGSSEIRSATSQSIVPNDEVTTVGYGTISGIVPNTQTREVLLLPLERRNYIGVNANSTVKVYHNGRVSRRRVLFDNDSEISFLINSPTGFYSDTLVIKKDRQVFSADDYDVETIGFGEARVHLRNIADLDSGLHKLSFIVPGDGYIRKEYNVSLLRSTSSTRLVKVFPNPYKYGEHGDLKIEYFIPRDADSSEYILLIANVKGDEMDSISMSAMSDNTGMAYWDTFRVIGNYGSGLYMIALMDKNKRKIYDRKYILVEK